MSKYSATSPILSSQLFSGVVKTVRVDGHSAAQIM